MISFYENNEREVSLEVLEKLLLTLGVLTVYKPLESEFSGIVLKTNDNLFMLINSALPIGRQNFNFQMCNAGRFDKKYREEYNADIFSSYFLMPEAALMNQIPEKELGGEKLFHWLQL